MREMLRDSENSWVQLLLTVVNYTFSLWKSHLWGILILLFSYFLPVFLTCLDIMSQILLNRSFQLSLVFLLLLPAFTLLTILANFHFQVACSLVVYWIFVLPPALHFSPLFFTNFNLESQDRWPILHYLLIREWFYWGVSSLLFLILLRKKQKCTSRWKYR